MKFSETVRKSRPELVVSHRHEQWLGRGEPAYSETALAFAVAQLAKEGRKRAGTVSASSLGECLRYQQFVYLGMERLVPTAQALSRMMNGSFMHLRWQMAGLSAGWLVEAEVPVESKELGLMGTMDGICEDGSVLELKSINSHGYGQVVTFGPLREHLFQMATYMLCSGRERGVFLYENKNTQEYTEQVVSAEQMPLKEASERAEVMWDGIRDGLLAEPLGKCLDREGWRYESCPFRDRCLGIRGWEEVA